MSCRTPGARMMSVPAESSATHAEEAAHAARQAATRAAEFARENRAGVWADAKEAVETTKAEETAAREAYHEAERHARERLLSDRS
jgi:hypothetical protein